MATTLTTEDLVVTSEIRHPRGAARTYTLTVTKVTIAANGTRTETRLNLTDYTVFMVAKADIDDEHEMYRRMSTGNGARRKITTVPVANLNDGETFTLDDGENTATVFEFDITGNGVSGGNTAVSVSSLTTADEVRDAIVAAINGETGLDMTAWAIDDALVYIQTDHDHASGSNTSSADTVADEGFVITDINDGLDANDSFEKLAQSGETEGQAVLKITKTATDDVGGPLDWCFAVWVVDASGDGDAVIDFSPYYIDKRVPNTLP